MGPEAAYMGQPVIVRWGDGHEEPGVVLAALTLEEAGSVIPHVLVRPFGEHWLKMPITVPLTYAPPEPGTLGAYTGGGPLKSLCIPDPDITGPTQRYAT